MGKDYVSIRARDKTTGKDLILRVPKDASMSEVMEEYTRKFNEQEGKTMSREEFRFVSNGETVEKDTHIEDLPTGAEEKKRKKDMADAPLMGIGCGMISCTSAQEEEAGGEGDCSIM